MSEEISVSKAKSAAKPKATADPKDDAKLSQPASSTSKQTQNIVDPALPLIRDLAQTLCEFSLTELKLERDGMRIVLSRSGDKTMLAPQMMVAPPAAASIVAEAPPSVPSNEPSPAKDTDNLDVSNHPGVVKAPMVGTVYLSPEPGAPIFVKEGDDVREGQTLLLVEAMKTFNAISAPRAGRLTRILAGDGQPVEYGEPLLIIE